MTEIILGPPGTGKTTALLGAVEQELARGVAPERIGYVSYTLRAAHEARDRACQQFGFDRKQLPYFRTLHSMCFRMLGMNSGMVLEGARLQEFAKYAGVTITGRWSEDGTLSGFDVGDRILHMHNLARVRGTSLLEQHRQNPDGLGWDMVNSVVRDLGEFKRQLGYADFTDMLDNFVQHGSRPPLEVLIVDEVQDLSWLQWQVVWKLAAGCRRFLVAGDDDQAIYLWAGADVDQLINLSGDVRVLGHSWRVPPAIQQVALRVQQHISPRREKPWSPRGGSQGTVGHTWQFMDCDLGGPDILVLARNTYILRQQVIPVLREQGIIYEYNGHPSISPARLEAIQDWEHLRQGQGLPVPRARAVYDLMTSGRGVARGQKRLPQLTDDEEVAISDLQARGGLLTTAIWHEALDRIPQGDVRYIVTARQRGEHLGRPRVRVSTIHGSKGGQADHVILFREMARRSALELERSPGDEARVWYVGVTRAREQLTIVNSSEPHVCPWI